MRQQAASDLDAWVNSRGRDVLNFYDDYDVRRPQNMPIGNDPEGTFLQSSFRVCEAIRWSQSKKHRLLICRSKNLFDTRATFKQIATLPDDCSRDWIACATHLKVLEMSGELLAVGDLERLRRCRPTTPTDR